MAGMKDALFSQVKSAMNYNETRIDDNSWRYDQSWLYYMMQRPLNFESNDELTDEQRATLEYVEPVVFNAVESLRPQILDIFTENDEQAVRFQDNSFKPNPIMEQLINQQINRLVLQENDGYRVQENALTEAEVSGDCFTKIYMDEKHEDDKLPIQDWQSMEDVIAQVAGSGWKTDLPTDIADGVKKGEEGGIEWKTINVTPQNAPEGTPGQPTVVMRGNLPIYKVTKKLVIENVGLRDLIIDTSCGENFEKCRYICHKMNMTVGDAVDMGYNPKALRSASTNSRLADAPYNKFNLVTNSQIGESEEDYYDNGDEMERMITLYEHYIYSSIPNKGKKTALYQVHTTDCELLDYTEITAMPFVHGQIKTVPESFWGISMYDIFYRYQDQKSKDMRMAYKNAFDATYNKLLVTKGAYTAESVINSHAPGAIIEQTKEGGVQQFPFIELPQSYAIVSDKLDQSLQRTIGQMVGNMASQDTNPENMSGYAVSQILAQEQMKAKTVAKTWARTYVKPLYEKIYQVMKDNGIQINIPAGTKFVGFKDKTPQDTSVSSSDFPDIYDFIVDINTAGDQAMQNRVLAMTIDSITKTTTNDIVTNDTLYKMADRIMKGYGMDVADYLTDPSQMQKSQAQIDQEEFAKEGAKWQLQELIGKVMKLASETNLNEAKAQNDIQETMAKIQTMLTESLHKLKTGEAKAHNDAEKNANDADRNVIDAIATDAEIEQGRHDIVTKRAAVIQKQFNGVSNR